MSGYNATPAQVAESSNDIRIGRRRSADPYTDMAISALERGIKENDRYIDEEWLFLLCGLAGLFPEDYHKALDYFYGPVNKDEEE